MATRKVIAVDLGASSGRVMEAAFAGNQLTLSEIYRFPNIPVQVRNTLYWDILRLWGDIKDGLARIAPDSAAIGIDTWANDFTLLDRRGEMLVNPVHYRDERSKGMYDWIFERIPARDLYQRTGIQFMPQNTILHLASLAAAGSPLLDIAETFLMVPDLLNYWLTGTKVCEYTNATTTKFYNPHSRSWDIDLLETLGIPGRMFPEIIEAGTQVGMYNGVPVIAPATHDTGSAVVAVPMSSRNAAYISSGTWSLLGMELDDVLINEATFKANITNEGGAYGTIRFLKNVMGLWLVQQCRETWAAQGQRYSYEQLSQMALTAAPFTALIDPDADCFFAPGDVPQRLRDYCRDTGQIAPVDPAQVMRIVFESLALKYRFVLDKLIAITGKAIERLHIVGGGAQNAVLCQMTANAIGREVVAGPVEATALGNAVVQLIALGDLADMTEARALLSMHLDQTIYYPQDSDQWETAFARFRSLFRADSDGVG